VSEVSKSSARAASVHAGLTNATVPIGQPSCRATLAQGEEPGRSGHATPLADLEYCWTPEEACRVMGEAGAVVATWSGRGRRVTPARAAACGAPRPRVAWGWPVAWGGARHGGRRIAGPLARGLESLGVL